MLENLVLFIASISPFSLATASAATCRVNGEVVPCGEIGAVLTGIMIAVPIILFALLALMILSTWFVFEKAKKPGWASLIPIYNIVNVLDMIGKPAWWVLLTFIPFVNFIVALVVLFHFVKVFGKGLGFALGLIFLPFIFLPILAFGKSVYTKPEGGVKPVGDLNLVPPAPKPDDVNLTNSI